MKYYFDGVIRHRKVIMICFAVLFILCAAAQGFVDVNYDMNSYLPEDSASTVALDVMEEEFDGGIPNARVMIYDVSIPEAQEYKRQLLSVDGVTDVTWLDDVVDVKQPLETMEADVIENYYKDDAALFVVTIEEDKILSAVSDIRALIGEDNAMTGSAVSTAVATESTVSEIKRIAVFAVLFIILVLVLTTSSWIEPIVVMVGLGVAVVLNAGSNIIFGEISFVTNAAGNILQLAVSLDYSVFLIHRFEEVQSGREDNESGNEGGAVKVFFVYFIQRTYYGDRLFCFGADAVWHRTGSGSGAGKGRCDQPDHGIYFYAGIDSHDIQMDGPDEASFVSPDLPQDRKAGKQGYTSAGRCVYSYDRSGISGKCQ